MYLHRLFLWITVFSHLAGENNNMVLCSLKNQIFCSVDSFSQGCDPQLMMMEYPLLFGWNESALNSQFPKNLRSKVISLNNGTIGIMLIWQQSFNIESTTSTIKGFQLTMEQKDGIDMRKGRCFIMQLKNSSHLIVSYRPETFYLIIEDIQPMSSYTFMLNNLPRSNPFWHIDEVLKTNLNMSRYEGKFEMLPGNWDQYIYCVFIKETNDLEVFLELPPNDFKLTVFEINLFKNGNDGIADIIVNSSIKQKIYDQNHLFNNGYIIVKYNIKQKMIFAEVWVTPVDNAFPSDCLCYLKNKHCIACRTATTTCNVNNDNVGRPEKPENSVLKDKSDILAWVSVGSILACACIFALILFRRRRSCSGNSAANPSNQPVANINNDCLPAVLITVRTGSESDSVTIDNDAVSLPLVDSYRENELQSQNDVTDTYFHFVPPESSSETLSKSVSEQMLDINRDFFIPKNSGSNYDEDDILSETNSVVKSDVYSE